MIYQRVNPMKFHQTIIFPWFSYGFPTFPTVFLGFAKLSWEGLEGATTNAIAQGSEEKHQLALDLAYRPGGVNFLLPLRQYYLGEPRTRAKNTVLGRWFFYAVWRKTL